MFSCVFALLRAKFPLCWLVDVFGNGFFKFLTNAASTFGSYDGELVVEFLVNVTGSGCSFGFHFKQSCFTCLNLSTHVSMGQCKVVNFSGKRLKEIRKAAGVKAEELAQAVGVSRPTISNWERGKIIPTTENFHLIAKFFDCSTSDFQDNSPNEGLKSEISEKVLSIFKMVAAQRGQSLDDLLYPVALEFGKRVLHNPEITDQDLLRDAKDILK